MTGFLLLQQQEIPAWLTLVVALGTGLVSATAVVVTNSATVKSLRSQISEYSRTVATLTTAVQSLATESAVRTETMTHLQGRVEELKDSFETQAARARDVTELRTEVELTRRNLHDLRNWLLDYVRDRDTPTPSRETLRKLEKITDA